VSEKRHVHDELCLEDCTREWDIRGDTATGFHKLVKIRAKRGKLRKDESLLYWITWHFWQTASKGFGQAFGLLSLLLVILLAKRCGVDLPGTP
jgi:hypothetical protein